MPPYEPIIKNVEMVKRHLAIIQRDYRKAPKPHKPRNARHGRPRGRR